MNDRAPPARPGAPAERLAQALLAVASPRLARRDALESPPALGPPTAVTVEGDWASSSSLLKLATMSASIPRNSSRALRYFWDSSTASIRWR